LQRLQFTSPDGVRLARELWEILRRKKGCTLSRLYRSAQDDALWLAYSEWNSLGELAGARREAARSPLNRRLHSMLAANAPMSRSDRCAAPTESISRPPR
jgi:hypothetical protein